MRIWTTSFGRLVILSSCHLVIALAWLLAPSMANEPQLLAGFAEADITPKLGDKPVWLAGFGHNRKATAVHDPIMARAVVLKHGQAKIAIVSLDVVGYFHEQVEKIRAPCPASLTC